MAPTETLLTGAHLADGTGTPLHPADVLIQDDRITAVTPPGQIPRNRATTDLTGLVLAPGFIDVHSHADNAPLLPYDDTSKILQGVTTEVTGNCGFSLAPRTSKNTEAFSTFLDRLFPPLKPNWTSFHELFDHLDEAGHVTNHCPLIGHGTVRVAALGNTNHTADQPALRTMQEALEEGMTAGAFGLSSGLIYPPAAFATTDELLALAQVLAGNGLYATHLRNEGAGLLDSIEEALLIGATAGRTHISHLKAAGPANWGKLPLALERLHQARREGRAVRQDVYPYTASSTMLTSLLPPEFMVGDTERIVNRLASPAGHAELTAALAKHHSWDDVLIATTADHRNEGQTIAELATSAGAHPVEVLIELLVSQRLRVSMVHFSMHGEDLDQALLDAHTLTGSDGLPPGTDGKPHPRLYGTFPRVLGRYCRQRAMLELPEAIRRMTSLPARTFRIPERGRIRPGYVADLVAFNAATVLDVGTYRDPVHQPEGIFWVIQSGRTVVRCGQYVGSRTGQRLRPAG